MRAVAAALALVALLAAGCGDGATKYTGEPSDALAEAFERFGSCTLCHQETAVFMIETGGHKSLNLVCEVCHPDLTPGEVGPGHRGIQDCANCHPGEATHEYPTTGTEGDCADCHEPHGSTNLSLVRKRLVTPEGAVNDVTFTNRDGLADGSFANATEPGTGVCEICHVSTEYYRADGMGDDHFTLTCTACHTHTSGFSPP